jgi:hypothetical protein
MHKWYSLLFRHPHIYDAYDKMEKPPKVPARWEVEMKTSFVTTNASWHERYRCQFALRDLRGKGVTLHGVAYGYDVRTAEANAIETAKEKADRIERAETPPYHRTDTF